MIPTFLYSIQDNVKVFISTLSRSTVGVFALYVGMEENVYRTRKILKYKKEPSDKTER